MLKSKKRSLSVISLIAVVCFSLGFATAQSIEDVKWVGYLVHGAETQVDKSIVPEPSKFSPKVDGDIALGLRDDGVVVWKQIPDSTR